MQVFGSHINEESLLYRPLKNERVADNDCMLAWLDESSKYECLVVFHLSGEVAWLFRHADHLGVVRVPHAFNDQVIDV